MAEWKAFYELDPWGDQRADVRMVMTVWAALAPHTKTRLDPFDFMPFPDGKHEIPDNVTAQEAKWMMTLNRKAEEG